MSKDLDFQLSIHNKFIIKVFDVKTNELKREETGYNTICDGLWTNLFGGKAYSSYILIGDGTGTPSSSDTTLFNKIAAKAIYNSCNFGSDGTKPRQAAFDESTGVLSVTASCILNSTELNGYSISEVGIGYNDTNCSTHSVLKDLNGNPIVIQKTSNDIIQILSIIYLHCPINQYYNNTIQINVAPFLSGERYAYTDNINLFFLGSTMLSERSANSSLIGTAKLYRAVYVSYDTYKQTAQRGDLYFKTCDITASPVYDLSNKTISFSYRIDASYGNNTLNPTNSNANKTAAPVHYYSGKCNTNGIRYFMIYREGPSSSAYNYYSSTELRVDIGPWINIPLITNEAIGTGDGSTTNFASAFPYKSNGVIYVNGNISDGQFIDVEAATFFSDINIKPYNEIVSMSNMTSSVFNQFKTKFQNYNIDTDEILYDTTTNTSFNYWYFVLPQVNFTSAIFETVGAKIKKIYISPTAGSYTFSASYGVIVQIEGSDDLINWTVEDEKIIGNYGGSYTSALDEFILTYPRKYIRFKTISLGTWFTDRSISIRILGVIKEHGSYTNIKFTTPPPAGAQITADYIPDCIAKDENHVFDFNVTYHVNEYQGS